MQVVSKQRGAIAQIWLYGAAALILIAALTGLVVAWRGYTTGIDKQGYDRGMAETTAAYVARDNQQLQAALAAQSTAELNARNAEARAAASENLAHANYQKGLTDGQAKTAALVAAANAGTLQLRDPGQVAGTCTAGRGGVGEASANSAGPGNDGTGAGGLPKSDFWTTFNRRQCLPRHPRRPSRRRRPENRPPAGEGFVRSSLVQRAIERAGHALGPAV